ncbi:MAG TPA: fibronectin type III domain-containing protein [Candidatus Dormibacteraeota bacterium]|nr:fibronectin type III domain-containing protein [Candidatus Dormibacteraeota bacterium]
MSAAQQGNHVLLTFAVPEYSAEGRPLEHPPTVEIYRDFEPVPSSGELPPASPNHPALLVTIPSELVPRYSVNGQFRYSEALRESDFSSHPDSIVVYSVRTRVADKRLSAVSNLAALPIYPAPEAIGDLAGKVTPSAVVLNWTPPQKTPVGPVPPLGGYRMYRGEAKATGTVTAGNTGNSAAAPLEVSNPTPAPLPGLAAPQLELQSPLVKIGESTSPSFSDTQAEFGKAYVYSVRSVLDYAGTKIESSDSNFLVITPRDTFPPAAPTGLVAVDVPAAGGAPAHVDLSWAVSPESDVAGYQVYRSEPPDTQATRVNNHLLLTPAFRDMNVVSGRSYSYTVTAVDRSGNESEPSAAASVMVPAANRAQP